MTVRFILVSILLATNRCVEAFSPQKATPNKPFEDVSRQIQLFAEGGSKMLKDLKSRLQWNLKPEKSADIYMNPASKKIAEIIVTWEPDAAKNIAELAKRMDLPDGRPLLVGVVGIPGSGKSTSCDLVAKELPNAIVMPMDGYHYSLAQLNEMENPADVIYRRGAPDTFDSASLEKDLLRILDGNEYKVRIPGFDHAVGDPIEEQHTFVREKHEIVICEGIYLLHDSDGWEGIKKHLDYSIYIQADIDTCIDRLKERNKCIPGYTEQEIEARCDLVDRKNAEMAQHSRQFADKVVKSGAISTEEGCEVDGL